MQFPKTARGSAEKPIVCFDHDLARAEAAADPAPGIGNGCPMHFVDSLALGWSLDNKASSEPQHSCYNGVHSEKRLRALDCSRVIYSNV